MKKKVRIYEKKEKRGTPKTIRLSESEANELQKKVAESGLNQTEFIIRSCLNQKIEKVEFGALVAENLHKVYRVLEENKSFTTKEKNELRNLVSAMALGLTRKGSE